MSKEKIKLVVGIGASAGGLAVLKEFVRSLPEKAGMAFVIIQHLDPAHKSMLSELLAADSHLPVHEAEDGQKIEPDNIYVIPPDTYLELKDARIKLSKPEKVRGLRKAVDYFFRSLAREWGDRCAGIILSGAGGDGTAGLREIKATGGLTLAQAPDTAEHTAMPLSAIKAQVVDKVASVEQMASILKNYANHSLSSKAEDKPNEPLKGNLEEITAILRMHEEFDIRQYKLATVQRRIARRMGLANASNYKEYIQFLLDDADERKHLTNDILVNVTNFFRDTKAFNILEEDVIPSILKCLKKGEDIRVWVAGCASGEEAYSISILLCEALSKAGKTNAVKIFATDRDEQAIHIARKGIYPESIASEIPKKYLEKYFVRMNGGKYKATSQIRDVISFAVHNVIADPPFLHMHLISCRNLLIYLKKEIQEKVLKSFYYALEGEAYLFLGNSEAVDKTHLFKIISKKARLYQKIPGSNGKQIGSGQSHVHRQYGGNTPAFQDDSASFKHYKSKGMSRSDQIRYSILEAIVPSMVVVDHQGQILYNHGDLRSFLIIPTGEPRQDILSLVIPALRTRLRSAFYKVRKNGENLSFYSAIPEKGINARKRIRVDLVPLGSKVFSKNNAIGIVFCRGD